MEQKIIWGILCIVSILCLLFFTLSAVVRNENQIILEENELFKTILLADNELIDISSARNASGGINITASNFTIANAPSGWKITECPVSGVVYGNNTVTYLGTTNYTMYESSGIIQILPNAEPNVNNDNDTYIDYTYCLDGYNTNGGSRSIAGFIGLFALLALAVWVATIGIKEWLNR